MGTPAYNPAEFLVPNVSSITTEFTVRYSFHLCGVSGNKLLLIFYLMKRLISALNLFINEDQVIDGISERDFKTILLLFKKKPYLKNNFH